MAQIVIIGAGLTGLSAAYHLERSGFNDYVLFEKEAMSGGLCRSISQDGFTFDFTGHLLHVNNNYFEQFIQKTLSAEHHNAIHRRSFIYSHETYTKYPFQMNLYGLPASVITECISGFVNRPHSTKEPRSFDQWVLKHFGPGIAKHFFFPFQRKIFDYSIEKISPAWTGRFVPHTSLERMIMGALCDVEETSIGYNSSFIYPKKDGIMSWINSIKKLINNPIRTGYTVRTIDVCNKIIHFTNGHSEQYQKLITTMPLDTLLKTIKEPSSLNIKRAASKLVCNSVVNFNLGINRPDLSDKHWIYFPENEYPFYRLGFPHNFSKNMVPRGCSSLYGEFSHNGKSQEHVNELLKTSIIKTKQLLHINNADVLTEVVIPITHAYVLYTLWRQKNLPNLLETLKTHHIHSIGRYGGWKYASMQEAVLDGKIIADTIVPTYSFRNCDAQFTVQTD
jgi:protoporphyrinogen oxidase